MKSAYLKIYVTLRITGYLTGIIGLILYLVGKQEAPAWVSQSGGVLLVIMFFTTSI